MTGERGKERPPLSCELFWSEEETGGVGECGMAPVLGLRVYHTSPVFSLLLSRAGSLFFAILLPPPILDVHTQDCLRRNPFDDAKTKQILKLLIKNGI